MVDHPLLNDLDMSLDNKSVIHARDPFVDRVVALNQVRRVSADSGIMQLQVRCKMSKNWV